MRPALVLAAALALAGLAAAAPPGEVFTAAREQVDNPERSRSAVSRFEKLLGEIGERVSTEVDNTELQWRITEAQYLHDIGTINNTLTVALYNRTQMDARLMNMTGRMNVLRADLDSLDSRIQQRTKRQAEIDVQLADGGEANTRREVRFQDRTAYAKTTVTGIDNVIDEIGSNSVDEVPGSLRQALNTDSEPYNEPAPPAEGGEASGGEASVGEQQQQQAQKPSLVELAAELGVGVSVGAGVGAGVGVGDDLDQLRLLLNELHKEMHAYMDHMGTVRVKQQGDWAHEANNLREERARLDEEAKKLEATRAPNLAEMTSLRDSFASLSLARISVNNEVEETQSRLDKKVRGLSLLRAGHHSEQSARERQLETVDQLEHALKLHDGNVPHQTHAAAKEVALAGSAEEQRLKRIKAALVRKPQTSGTSTDGAKSADAGAAKKGAAEQRT